MTDPAPQAPDAGKDPQGAPEPPAPSPSEQLAELEKRLKDATSTIETERRGRIKWEAEVAKIKASQMNDAEKAIAKARDEGKSEALKTAGARLAAAEFRAKAAARLGNLADALDIDLIDFSRFTDEAGEPDIKRIEASVDKLAQALPEGNGRPAAPQVPAGPRPDPGEQDWLRSAIAAG